VCEIAENIGRAEVSTSSTYRLLQRLDMLAGGGRVVDLIRQVVSLLANETILEKRREPTYSLLCWYCTRLRRESPEIEAKSVRCDYYRGQVLEEEYFFIGFVRMQTGLHFEAFYASWISL
jgi:hypothetical protein